MIMCSLSCRYCFSLLLICCSALKNEPPLLTGSTIPSLCQRIEPISLFRSTEPDLRDSPARFPCITFEIGFTELRRCVLSKRILDFAVVTEDAKDIGHGSNRAASLHSDLPWSPGFSTIKIQTAYQCLTTSSNSPNACLQIKAASKCFFHLGDKIL